MTDLPERGFRPFFHVAAGKLRIKVVYYRFIHMSP